MAKKRKKHTVKLKSIVVECSKLAEKIPHSFGTMKIEAKDLGLYGNHDYITLSYKCLCGESHNVNLEYSW